MMDWGLGIGDWAQSPIPNSQYPIPNNHNHHKISQKKKQKIIFKKIKEFKNSYTSHK